LDKTLSQDEIYKLLNKFRFKALEILESEGKIDGLLEIRGLIVDHPSSEFAPYVNDHTLTILYLVRKILADVWVNLGTDATYDLIAVENELTQFSYQLANFVQIALSDKNESDERVWRSFSKVVRSYCEAIESIQERLFSPKPL